ncbi:MAG: kinase [Rhodospirillaceae bacterium]|nr:kinase [Rhodospirillaceae bacterium]
MIIVRTPFRISFFGGGTDYPVWFREHGGAVLSTTINKYCYISARFLPPFFDYRNRIVWSRIETVPSIYDIEHPSVRATLCHLGIVEGVEIHHFADLPARAGLGSSSSFTVGLLNALNGILSRVSSKSRLAEDAIYIERDMLEEKVGVQDQIAVAHGGLNHIVLRADDTWSVHPQILPRDLRTDFENHLMLFYSGLSRHASVIADEKIKAIPNKQGVLTEMAAMVDPAIQMLHKGAFEDFGKLLHENWLLKRSITPSITTETVDDIYAKARQEGALGGKVLGAGGGGFVLIFAKPEKQDHIRKALNGFLEVPFQMESSGTQIVFCAEDIDKPALRT